MNKDYKRFLEASAKRRVEARKLREKGLSYTEIGEKLGITRQRAFQIAGDPLFVQRNRRAGDGASKEVCQGGR